MKEFFYLLADKTLAADSIIGTGGFTGPLDTKAGTGIVALAERIYQLFIAVAYPLAFIALLYVSYTLITSAGNPEGYAKAKKQMIYVITGIFLIVFSTVLINLVIGLLN